MARLLIPLVLFGLLIYAIFGSELRDRLRFEPRAPRWIASLFFFLDLALLGFIVLRVPIFRTLPGLMLLIPLWFVTHVYASRRIVFAMRARGWIRWPDVPKTIPHSEDEVRWRELFARHFYLMLGMAYVLTVGLVLIIHHVTRP